VRDRNLDRVGPGPIIVNTLMLWVGLALAALALWPIYRSPQLVIMVIAATVLGSAIAIFGAVFRWSAPVVLGVSFVVFLLFGVPLAVPSEATMGLFPSSEGIVDLLSGVALGWKQLLTISIPVGAYESLLVPFYALIFVVAVVSLTIALRSRRAGEVAAFGPVIVFVAAIAFGSTSAQWPAALSLGLLASSLVWIVWRRWNRRRASIRLLSAQLQDDSGAPREIRADTRFVATRTLLGAGLVLLLASGTAVAAAEGLPPTGTRAVLRESVDQPFEPRDYASPLSGFRSYWQPSAENSVMLTVQGLPAGSRIRIATLDTYDGVVYSVGSPGVNTASGSFTRVPFEFEQTGVRGRQVSVAVTIQSYRGVWLPTVGDFEKATFSGSDGNALRNSFYYNNTTGTAAVVDKVKTGDTYTLAAIVPTQPSLADLSRATAGTASVPPATVLPAELTSVLGAYTQDAATQGEKLVAMIQALKKNGYVSHGVGSKEAASRSGHAADRINELLTAQQMIGDGEQYSVTAALMARQLGFPARVVLGFVPETTGAGTSEIRGKDVSAWIEVDTAQYGWVTVDPNPPVRPIPTKKPQDPNQVARPQTIVPPAVTQASPPDPQTVPDAQQHDADLPNAFLVIVLAVLQVLGWVLLGVAIVLSPFLVIMGIKARKRRRRRSAATPVEQISGGWREYEDRVLDHGFEPPAAATRSEVATTVGGAQTLVLAAVADRATFAPGLPEDGEADLVWHSVRELSAALDAGKTRWERIKARISLRSLGTVGSLRKR
jgi:hypothetical protein